MIHVKTQVAGFYKFQAYTPGVRRSRRDLTGWIPNLITNGGLDRFATANWGTHCQVGTGTTAPANGDTSLVSLLAQTSTINSNTTGNRSSSLYYCWRRLVFRFAAGVAAGNLAEVGVGWATSGSLFSRALIVDGGGSPTTITVLSTEVLDVTYELRLYPPETDSSYSVVDSVTAINHSCVTRAANVTSFLGWEVPVSGVAFGANTNTVVPYNGSLGAITGAPTGTTGSNATLPTTNAYVPGSYQRTGVLTLNLNDGNIAGGMNVIFNKGTDVSCTFAFQTSFSPAIAKTSSKTLLLGYRVSWARRP